MTNRNLNLISKYALLLSISYLLEFVVNGEAGIVDHYYPEEKAN
jgi:hypothetical protein